MFCPSLQPVDFIPLPYILTFSACLRRKGGGREENISCHHESPTELSAWGHVAEQEEERLGVSRSWLQGLPPTLRSAATGLNYGPNYKNSLGLSFFICKTERQQLLSVGLLKRSSMTQGGCLPSQQSSRRSSIIPIPKFPGASEG